MAQVRRIDCRCCIAGGGPAGMMLGFLLARAGVDVVVLEKHADFLRDFRGDTVHPSTMQVLQELGLLEAFLQRPHDEARELRVTVSGREAVVADFSRLRHPFVALMPQWEFLNFLREQAQTLPGFRLLLNTQADGLLHEAGRVSGVQASTRGSDGRPDGKVVEIHADLVVACDGRHSVLRRDAGLPVRDLGAPIDVLWMRLPRLASDPPATGGYIERGRFFIAINRGDYWQCAFVIGKGGIDALHARGLPAFHRDILAVAPFFGPRVADTLQDWQQIKLLTVAVDRLERWWQPGLLVIGDAAHAMSPVGGVGINLAVQDAVAAANRLAAPLADGQPQARLDALLQEVQQRRLFPVRVTQALQVAVQERLLGPIVRGRSDLAGPPLRMPLPLRLLQWFPWLRVVPAWLVGVGARPEHVRSPASAVSFTRPVD